jgi:Sugar-transfer associated ATP-grasp
MIKPGRAWIELKELLASQWKNAARARADDGVGSIRQFVELVRLRVGPGKLEPADYYRMRVYRRDMGFGDKLQFLSQRAVSLPKQWNVVANDKLLTYMVLIQEGIRIPQLRAICHPLRTFGQVPSLTSTDAVSAYLRGPAQYPFIAKPITGVFSRDVSLIEGIDRNSDRLRLDDGEVEVGEFAKAAVGRTDGTLFQELLAPHPDIASKISQRLCTLRLIVLLERDRVRLFRAYWKIAVGKNLADNYWRPGNLIASLDSSSGRVVQCMTGLGPDFRVVDVHPQTGVRLPGYQVPLFAEAVAMTLRIAPAFAGMKMQAWDMALTTEGPIPLEVNEEGSVFLPQVVDGHGMNDQAFREYRRQVRQQR